MIPLHDIHKLYSLKAIMRYGNTFKIKEESVAEHSFFVAIITMELHTMFRFDLDKAIQIALVHDVLEMYTTDIPYNVKENYPKIKEALRNSERDIYGDIRPSISRLLLEYEELKTNEAMIVKLADKLSVLQFSTLEVSLGNTGDMKGIQSETLKIVENLYSDIRHLERSRYAT